MRTEPFCGSELVIGRLLVEYATTTALLPIIATRK